MADKLSRDDFRVERRAIVDDNRKKTKAVDDAKWPHHPDTARKRSVTCSEMPPSWELSDSPKRIRSSPPQRLETSQNQEWLSPHRIIDRPNPEEAHGSWVPAAEGFAFGVAEDRVDPENLPRPASQATYTVRRSIFNPRRPSGERPPVRKIAVLEDFEPKKPAGGGAATSVPQSSVVITTTSDNIKRIVHPDGRIVKVSTLDDFSAARGDEKLRSDAEIGAVVTSGKPAPRRTTLKKMVLNDLGKPTASSPRKTTKPDERKSAPSSDAACDLKAEEEVENNKENKPRNGEDELEKPKEEVDEVMTELKKILNDRKDAEDEDNGDGDGDCEASAKRKSVAAMKKTSNGTVKKLRTTAEDTTGKSEPPPKKKRDLDLKAVQKYIKQQKMKRVEQLKIDREKKATEEEARKKKLEALRVRTLQLAATSKRKVAEGATQVTSSIKVVEPEAEEEDVTMSLGLKQIKPKVSYNESVLNLRKKHPPRTGTKKQDPTPVNEVPDEKPVEIEQESVPALIGPKCEAISRTRPDVEMTTNLALKKLAETLQMKMQHQKKAIASPAKWPCKSYRDAAADVSERDLGGSVVTVDVDTIKSLKQDIIKISQNFQILHEIITDKASSTTKDLKLIAEPIETRRVAQMSLVKAKPNPTQMAEGFPSWMRSVMPRPHPYNVLTALRNKMKLTWSSKATPSTVTSGKSDSESERVPPTTGSSSQGGFLDSMDLKTKQTSSEDNYYSLKEDSGSEFSSSILDSDDRIFTKMESLKKPQDSLKFVGGNVNTPQSTVVEDVSSISIDSATLGEKTLTDSRNDFDLIPPHVQLVSTGRREKNISSSSNTKSIAPTLPTAISDSSDISEPPRDEAFDKRSEAIVTEITEDTVDTQSLKTSSGKVESTVARVNDVYVSRTFFNPEALHLQFQAELSLLETFQRSLAHFLEIERMKALRSVNIKSDKAVNTDVSPVQMEERPLSVVEERVREDTDSVKTEFELVKTQEDLSDSAKTVKDQSDFKSSKSSDDTLIDTKFIGKKKSSEKLDVSDTASGISFQMLNRMMKDEELRSEHQLALIRLREKTLNEKLKAELTLLELRKKALKERGSNEESAISAIKKKQRGILLKYQNEREDIERLKKMHRIASEERKIMIKQQKQIRQMQVTTKDMLIKLKKREKSPQKRVPIKLKGSKYDSQSEIQEELSFNMSENTFTESITSLDESINHSIDSDRDVTSRSNVSEGDDEILRRNTKALEEKISKSIDKSVPVSDRKHLKRGPSVEELLKWTKRLEEKENQLKELELEAAGESHPRQRSLKSFRDVKSFRDRSTSPFHFQEVVKSICESSPSLTEAIEAKKSSTIVELIQSSASKSTAQEVESSLSREKGTADSVPEKLPTSASEDIPEEFSKKTPATSRSVEYNSESFESSSDTHKSKVVPAKKNDAVSSNGITIKMALSPRVHSTRRRYSSGSDDSVNLHHTETASEQSDVEIRIAALHEQLRKRKLEAERLRREQKKAYRERLKAKEQSLLKQIEAYDTYIQKKKQELEQEYQRSPRAPVKPVIRTTEKIQKDDIPKLAFRLRDGEEKPAAPESESEITESIKAQSVDEEAAAKKDADSTVPSEIVSDAGNKESASSATSSVLESLPRQGGGVVSDGSHSESDEQTLSNASVKTTLLSPGKPESEVTGATTTPTVSEQCVGAASDAEQVESEQCEIQESAIDYYNDSFESESVATNDDSVEKRTSSYVEELSQVTEEEEDKVEYVAEKCIAEESKSLEEQVRQEAESRDELEEAKSAEEEEEGEGEAAEEEEATEVIEDEEVPSSGIDEQTGVEELVREDAVKNGSRIVDFITDSVLNDLVSESVAVMMRKAGERLSNEAGDGSSEALANLLAEEIVSEVIIDALKIYNRKRSQQDEKEKTMMDVRRRVQEIMSQAPSTKREQRRPQDIMVTTYDVPEDYVEEKGNENEDLPEREEFLQSLSPKSPTTRREEEAYEHVDVPALDASSQQQSGDGDAFGQEWFDDDFGLSRSRREAEELRVQQLQIEQEIQQLQAQQEQVLYYYLRQIPNKPPPPYTPPGTATAERFTSESEITAVMSTVVRYIADEMRKDDCDLSEIQAPASFLNSSDNEHVRCYKAFLFDLAKHIISEIVGVEFQEKKLPWMRTNERLVKFRMKKVEKTYECLFELVMKQVLVLFGFRQKMGKERLIVRWSRKKRDHVDELLVGESQEEEAEWTQYDEDEVTVKNNVTIGILDSLLDETAQLVNTIWTKKMKGNEG